MGMFRKAMSLGTMGVVSYRSNSERQRRAAEKTAKYSRQARNAARMNVVQNGVDLELQREQLEFAQWQAGIAQAQLEEQMRPAVRQAPPSIPPGWYTDPTDDRALCWWNGSEWDQKTKHYPQLPPTSPSTGA